MNAATDFYSGIVVVQFAQDCLFHLVLSRVSNGKAISEITLFDSVQFDGSQQACDTLSGKILANSALWKMDLTGVPGPVNMVAGNFSEIYRLGLPGAPNRIAG